MNKKNLNMLRGKKVAVIVQAYKQVKVVEWLIKRKPWGPFKERYALYRSRQNHMLLSQSNNYFLIYQPLEGILNVCREYRCVDEETKRAQIQEPPETADQFVFYIMENLLWLFLISIADYTKQIFSNKADFAVSEEYTFS